MAKKIFLGGVVGGIIVFVWSLISHVVLPLGMVGIKELPNEEMVVTAMRENIKEPGLYMFPGMGQTAGMSAEEKKASMQRWEEKYRQGPNGTLLYQPQGQNPIMPKQMLIELLSNIVGALVAAYLLAKAVGGIASLGGKVIFTALLGLFASLAIDISYWNWYGFPGSYTLVQIFDQMVGWGLAGLALGGIIKKPAV